MYTKTFHLVIFFIFFSVFTYSQLSIGFHAGSSFGQSDYKARIPILNSSKFVVDWQYSPRLAGETKGSFSFGGIMEKKLYSFLYLQAEINFIDHRIASKASELNYIDLDGAHWSMDLSLLYFEIPLLLKIKPEFDNFSPYIFAGAGIGYLMKTEDYENIKYFYSIAEHLKSNQTFTLFGAGSEYKLNQTTNLFLTFRYSMSLEDVENSEDRILKPYNYEILFGVKTKLLDY